MAELTPQTTTSKISGRCVSYDVSGHNWYAVRVKTRYEESVAKQIRFRGCEILLPTRIERRRWSDRIKAVSTALFPSYVFCRFQYRHKLLIQTVPGVLGIVSFSPEGTPVENDEIDSLRILTTTGRRISNCAYVQTGRKVTITDGPLRGIIGIFEGQDRCGRLIVSVTLLARSIRVGLEPLDVSAVRPYIMPPVKPWVL